MLWLEIRLSIKGKGTFYEFATYPGWRFQNPMAEPDPKRKVQRSKTLATGCVQSNLLRSEDAISGVISQLLDYMNGYAQRNEPTCMHLDKILTYMAFDLVGEVLCGKPIGFLKEGKDVNNAIATNYFFQELVTWASHLRELHYIAVNPIMTWLSLNLASWLSVTTFAAVKDRRARPVDRSDVLSHWFKYLGRLSRILIRRSCARLCHKFLTCCPPAQTPLPASYSSVFYHFLRNPETLSHARADVEQIPGRAEQ